MPGGYRDLKVYQLAYKLAMVVPSGRDLLANRPNETFFEKRRSEFGGRVSQRRYQNAFINKLTDCDSEAAETQVWIDFAFDCGYVSKETHDELIVQYEEVGRMLSGMMAKPERFAPRE